MDKKEKVEACGDESWVDELLWKLWSPRRLKRRLKHSIRDMMKICTTTAKNARRKFQPIIKIGIIACVMTAFIIAISMMIDPKDSQFSLKFSPL